MSTRESSMFRFLSPALACLLLAGQSVNAAPQSDEVTELTAALKSGDVAQQIDAAVELGSLGPYASKAVPALIDGLKSDNQAVQFECTIALGSIGLLAASAEPALVEMLKLDSDEMRVTALVSLRRISASSAATIREVSQLADADSDAVAAAALRLLATSGNLDKTQQSAAIPRLIKCINDGSTTTGRNAARALAVIGADAVPAVMKVLESDNRAAVLRACLILAEIGPEASAATETLIGLTKSDDSLVVRMAAETLGEIGAAPQQTISALTSLLQSRNMGIRADAAQAIGQFGRVADSACGALCQALQDESVIVRAAAATAIGNVSTGNEETTRHLVAAVEDQQGSVTVSAANALAAIGKPAVPALLDLLKNDDYQFLAVSVLGEMGPDAGAAVPALTELLKTPDDELAHEVYIALASMGPAAKPATDLLLKILNSDAASERRGGAAWVLGSIGDKSVVNQLVTALQASDDEIIRRTCAWAVITLEPSNADYARQAVPLLSEALKSDRELVRSECLNALGGVGEPAKAILSQITEIAESDDSPIVRAAALHAMGRLKADSLEAVQAALSALDDDVVTVRNAAHFMIGSLGESARSAAPQLQETMRTSEPFERIVAAWALVRVAPSEENGKAAAPFMVSALQNADPRVRLEAAQTLGTIGIGTPEIVAALNAATSDEDAEVAKAAGASLQQLQ